MKISNSGASPNWTRHIKQGRDRVKGDIRWIGLEKAMHKTTAWHKCQRMLM